MTDVCWACGRLQDQIAKFRQVTLLSWIKVPSTATSACLAQTGDVLYFRNMWSTPTREWSCSNWWTTASWSPSVASSPVARSPWCSRQEGGGKHVLLLHDLPLLLSVCLHFSTTGSSHHQGWGWLDSIATERRMLQWILDRTFTVSNGHGHWWPESPLSAVVKWSKLHPFQCWIHTHNHILVHSISQHSSQST